MSIAVPRAPSRAPSTPIAALCLAVVAWGVSPLFLRQIDASGMTIALYRLWIGVPVMWILAAFTGGGRPRWEVLRLSAFPGVIFATDITMGFTAYQKTSVLHVALIGSLAPLVIGVVAVRRFGDHLSPRRIVWSVLAVGGALVVILAQGSGGRSSRFGDVLAALSLVTWTTYFLRVKQLRLDNVHAVSLMAGVITCAAVAITIPALVLSEDPGAIGGTDWIWLSLMAVVAGGFGHSLVNWAQRYVDASVSSVLLLGNTVVAVTGAWLVYDEALSPVQILGGVVVLGALAGLALSEAG